MRQHKIKGRCNPRPHQPFKISRMTTEEMNRVIAKWIGVDVDFDEHVYRDSRSPLRQYIDNKPKTKPLLFDTSYDWLMPVWQKLRGELEQMSLDMHKVKYTKETADYAAYVATLTAHIKSAILDSDITTAHRLMVEAITLIKG